MIAKIALRPFAPGPRETAEGLHAAIMQRLGIAAVCFPGGDVSGWITAGQVTYAITPLGLWRCTEDAEIARLADAYNVLCGEPQRVDMSPGSIQAAVYEVLPPGEQAAPSVLELLAQGAA